jgi:hypothetical protein
LLPNLFGVKVSLHHLLLTITYLKWFFDGKIVNQKGVLRVLLFGKSVKNEFYLELIDIVGAEGGI